MLEIKGLHNHVQRIAWIPGINILITIGSFTAFPAAVLTHSIGCTIITLLSILDSYSLLIKHLPLTDEKISRNIHIMLGALCITSAVFQCLLGIFSLLSNTFGVKMINVLMMKRLHMVSDMILTIMMKICIYHYMKAPKKPLWLTIDVVTIIICLYVRLKKKRLTYN